MYASHSSLYDSDLTLLKDILPISGCECQSLYKLKRLFSMPHVPNPRGWRTWRRRNARIGIDEGRHCLQANPLNEEGLTTKLKTCQRLVSCNLACTQDAQGEKRKFRSNNHEQNSFSFWPFSVGLVAASFHSNLCCCKTIFLLASVHVHVNLPLREDKFYLVNIDCKVLALPIHGPCSHWSQLQHDCHDSRTTSVIFWIVWLRCLR